MIAIGIDTGTHTGFAVWDTDKRKFIELDTLKIHEAMKEVELLSEDDEGDRDVLVIFEDARQRKWYGSRSEFKLQGAGSVKRDCNIWEDFLKDMKIPFKAVPPRKGATKLGEDYFRRLTGWTGRTSEHSRDAAMLVFGLEG